MQQGLDTIDKLIDDGKDINNLTWEIIKYTKDILLFKTSKKRLIYIQKKKLIK